MQRSQLTLLQEAERCVDRSASAARILQRVFDLFDSTGVAYCVLHGYETLPFQIGSDVDCVVDATPNHLFAVLNKNRQQIGADIVFWRGHYFVLAAREKDGSFTYLALDLARDCDLDDLPFYAGTDILASRRKFGRIWAPAPAMAFCTYLVRSIAKSNLEVERAQRLTDMFGAEPATAAREIGRFWSGADEAILTAAASSGDWEKVRARMSILSARLRRVARLRHAGNYWRNRLLSWRDRLSALWRPRGLSVVLLGPDGAGKSSTIDALAELLAPVFPRQEIRGFAPPLRRILGRGSTSTAQPHGLLARSLPTSLARAGYWLVFYLAGYIGLRIALARSTLVLYDRHFADILVDAKRYRYGGPAWVLRVIWRLMPRPDLVILLDAPAEVLQARKQEVPFAETVRQREAYLAFVRNLPNGVVLDACQQRATVAGDAAEQILRRQRDRFLASSWSNELPQRERWRSVGKVMGRS